MQFAGRLRLAEALTLLLITTACGQDKSPPGLDDRTVPRSAELVAPAGKALAGCKSLRFVRAACPKVVPKTDKRYVGRKIPFDSRFGTFELTSSAPYEGEPRRNRPPRFAHIVIEAGDLARRFEFDWPPAPTDREPAQLLSARRDGPVLLGRPEWGGRAGMLVLMPPFELGGIHGDHLIFQWRKGGVDYLLSLHAWVPFGQARATLRAIVAALPPP